MVFHEITREAIQRALGETRDIDDRLVDAQETRRILDRLYGYEVSPVLWKKVTQGLSAGPCPVGRDAARRRARARADGVRAGLLLGHRRHVRPGRVRGEARRASTGRASLRVATSATTGASRATSIALDEDGARSLAAALEGAPFAVRSVEEKPYRRSPAAPFMTSTLQQEASRKLRFSSQTTMRLAQRLYENGYITYMRTDSTTLSERRLTAARTQAAQLYGRRVRPGRPAPLRAQGEERAGGPRGDPARRATPSGLPPTCERELSRDEHALYELVWKRTVASQMEDARGQTASLRIGATASDGRDAEFGASGTVITFRGFLAAYEEGRDERSGRNGDDERRLPALEVGQAVEATCARARRPRDHAAGPLHRGVAREGARGPRHRPPVDVRLDHGHDPRPRLRLQEGHGTRADVPRVRGHPAPREALRPPRRLRLHRAARGRPRRDRPG